MRRNERLSAAQTIFAANAPILARMAMSEGDPVHGYLPSGTVTGLIEDRPSCDALVQRIVEEAEQTLARLCPRSDETNEGPLRVARESMMAIQTKIEDGVGELIIDARPSTRSTMPAGASSRRRWRRSDERAAVNCVVHPRRGARLPGGRRRQGAGRRRQADRRAEPRLLRHLRRHLRLPGPGDLRRPRLLHRGRHRHRRLLGLRDRLGGRDLRAARDRSRRARRRHPPDADGRHPEGAAHALHRRGHRARPRPTASAAASRSCPAKRCAKRSLELARKIAAKSPKALRLAKASLNGIELLDVKKSYRFEQGFTLELYTSRDSQEARDAFVEKREAKY